MAPPLLPVPDDHLVAQPTRSWSGREHAKRWRGLLVIAAALVVVAIVALITGQNSSQHGTLDPASYDPGGGRALATLLGERGVDVTRLNTVSQVLSHAKTATTVVVADPLNEPDLRPLRQLPAGSTLVLMAPDEDSLNTVQPGLVIDGQLPTRSQPLDCALPDAVVAGTVRIGGDSYNQRVGGTADKSCYEGILFVQSLPGGGGYVDVGSATALSNDQLDQAGNAALGIGLLSHHRSVLWLVPGPAPLATDGTTPLNKLLPARLGWAVLQLAVAVGLLMLWRVRRLGRVVPEPLPVTVRASETVEGLGRLYKAARARRRAAGALRAAALSRMAPRLGVRRDDDAAAMATAISGRTGRSAADVGRLLYGAEPEDDQALVALADQLDALEAEVRRS
jgi:Domain of unknown function (DUF4350)